MTDVLSAKLDEMLAGLEGVTPGPWIKGRRSEIAPVDGPAHEVGAPSRGIAASLYAKDAAHIARCDPDTMRQIITLAKQALSLPITAEPGEVDTNELLLLMRLRKNQQDNVHDVVEGDQEMWALGKSMSERGLLAIVSHPKGGTLHITKLGLSTLTGKE